MSQIPFTYRRNWKMKKMEDEENGRLVMEIDDVINFKQGQNGDYLMGQVPFECDLCSF